MGACGRRDETKPNWERIAAEKSRKSFGCGGEQGLAGQASVLGRIGETKPIWTAGAECGVGRLEAAESTGGPLHSRETAGGRDPEEFLSARSRVWGMGEDWRNETGHERGRSSQAMKMWEIGARREKAAGRVGEATPDPTPHPAVGQARDRHSTMHTGESGSRKAPAKPGDRTYDEATELLYPQVTESW